MNRSTSHSTDTETEGSQHQPYLPAPMLTNVNDERKTQHAQNGTLFENPFSIEDLAVFDDATMQRLLSEGGFGIALDDMAGSLHGASRSLIRRVRKHVPRSSRSSFVRELRKHLSKDEVK